MTVAFDNNDKKNDTFNVLKQQLQGHGTMTSLLIKQISFKNVFEFLECLITVVLLADSYSD